MSVEVLLLNNQAMPGENSVQQFVKPPETNSPAKGKKRELGSLSLSHPQLVFTFHLNKTVNGLLRFV